MMMRRLLLAFLVAAASLPVAAGPSWACSCAGGTLEEYAESAEVVITGRVHSVRTNDVRSRAEFRVSRVYKGNVGQWVEIATSAQGSACGYRLKEDERYTLFGTEFDKDRVSTSLCAGNKRGGIDPDRYDLPEGRRP